MTDTNLDDLDDELNSLCQKWLAACQGAGLKVGISQTYRSSAEQDADYAKGRTAPGDIITNARGGESPHNCVDENGDPASCAFDFFIYANDGSGKLDWNAADPQWQKAIAIGESLGLVSGSTFHSIKDSPHFELKGWNS